MEMDGCALRGEDVDDVKVSRLSDESGTIEKEMEEMGVAMEKVECTIKGIKALPDAINAESPSSVRCTSTVNLTVANNIKVSKYSQNLLFSNICP